MGFSVPNLPFGSSLDAFGVIDKIAGVLLPVRSTREIRSESASKAHSKMQKVHRIADELRSFFPESFVDDIEASTVKELMETAAAGDGRRPGTTGNGTGGEDELDENIWVLDEYDDDSDSVPVDDDTEEALAAVEVPGIVRRYMVGESAAITATRGGPPASSFSGPDTLPEAPSSSPDVLHSPGKRLNTGSPFASQVDGSSDKTQRSTEQRKMQEGRSRPAIRDARAVTDLYRQLQAKIPPGGACVQVVGVLEARCNKYACRGDIMQKIEKIVYDWVDYRLRVDIRQVKMLIPNGMDFRRTTPG